MGKFSQVLRFRLQSFTFSFKGKQQIFFEEMYRNDYAAHTTQVEALAAPSAPSTPTR